MHMSWRHPQTPTPEPCAHLLIVLSADPLALLASGNAASVKLGVDMLVVNTQIMNTLTLARAIKSCQQDPALSFNKEMLYEVGRAGVFCYMTLSCAVWVSVCRLLSGDCWQQYQ